MSKQLYPKPKAKPRKRSKTPKENLLNRPYHVEYSDDAGDMTEWGHYNSELEVKVAAWYRCKFLGFTPAATLYSREEVHERLDGDGSGS
jgi:hypothetical protein